MILFLCIFSKKIIRERCNSYVGISSSKVYDKEKLEMIQMSRNERKMNDCIFFPFLKLWQNSHNIKFTTLILLSVQFNGIYIHVVMQTTIHPHNSFPFGNLKLYTLLSPTLWPPPLYLLSKIWAALRTSYEWNQTVHPLPCLAYFT